MKLFILIAGVMCSYSSAQACLEMPKKIRLQNSSFPFSEFTMSANSFQYVTSDGMINTLQCQEDANNYSWNIVTELKGVITLYGHADVQAAGEIFADDKETGNRTPLTLTTTAKGGAVRIAKTEGQTAIELSCQASEQSLIMAAVMKNQQGTVIGSVEVSKLRGVRGLATFSASQPPASGSIDFGAQKLQQIRFSGCSH